MGTLRSRPIWLFLVFIFTGIILILYQTQYRYLPVLPPLTNHLYATNFSSLYKNLVLLSCSSDSYSSVYCYYLPFIALAWRRIGFEPIILLVGSEQKFERMPLINLLKVDLKMKYQFINVDPSRSISISQIARLFGGFFTYDFNRTKDLFILMADVDLLPITRRRFEIYTNETNYILAVNAYCCPQETFSYGNFHHMRYYPISYVGMNKVLWRQLFLPLNNCAMSSNVTVDMIECCLNEKMNLTLPRNVTKASNGWDIDQKLLSLLITRAEYFYGTYVDKRRAGSRLDPEVEFRPYEFKSILSYDDVHLPNTREDIMYTDRVWTILKDAFSLLFNNETIRLLSRYHHQTATSVLASKQLLDI